MKDYLCMVMQKEVARSQSFGSRESAQEYFRENFGAGASEKYEKYDLREMPVFGERQLALCLAGVCRAGGSFRVTEERYYCAGCKISTEEGILAARKRVPAALTENSIFINIARESPQTVERFQKEIRKTAAEAVRNFRKRDC